MFKGVQFAGGDSLSGLPRGNGLCSPRRICDGFSEPAKGGLLFVAARPLRRSQHQLRFDENTSQSYRPKVFVFKCDRLLSPNHEQSRAMLPSWLCRGGTLSAPLRRLRPPRLPSPLVVCASESGLESDGRRGGQS